MAIVPILWGLLNIILLVGLLIGLSTAFGSLKKRFGFLGALLLVMMLVSMCRSINKQGEKKAESGAFQSTVLQPNLPVNAFRRPYDILLDNQITFAIRQTISLAQIHQSDSIQINSQSHLTGFIAGISWLPVRTLVSVQSNQRLQYETAGFLNWQLLGLPIYSQPKQFDGHLNL